MPWPSPQRFTSKRGVPLEVVPNFSSGTQCPHQIHPHILFCNLRLTRWDSSNIPSCTTKRVSLSKNASAKRTWEKLSQWIHQSFGPLPWSRRSASHCTPCRSNIYACSVKQYVGPNYSKGTNLRSCPTNSVEWNVTWHFVMLGWAIWVSTRITGFQCLAVAFSDSSGKQDKFIFVVMKTRHKLSACRCHFE